VKFKSVDFAVLEEKFAIQILLKLRETGATPKGELYKAVSLSNATLMRRIMTLIDAGLVKETPRKQRPFTKIVELTPKGRRVAELLAKVEDELRRT